MAAPAPVARMIAARPWRIAADRVLPTGERPLLMGIVNATPDSFSDGGRHLDPTNALAHALRMEEEGADIVDIGGESTRPGAARVGAEEQIRRVIPVIRELRRRSAVVISVDTTMAAVAAAALDAGAEIVNDTSAGVDDPALLPLVASRGCGVVLMHRRHAPPEEQWSDRILTDSGAPASDIVERVTHELEMRVDAACAAGVVRDHIALDPGLGFGKSVDENLALIAGVGRLARLGLPLLIGASRKSFIGAVTGRSLPEQRLAGSIVAAILAASRGAAVLRVHDVGPHRDAIAMLQRLGNCEQCYDLDPESLIRREPMAGQATLTFTDGNFEQQVLQSDVPVLVDFWAEWCGPCRAIAPAIDEIAQEFTGRAKVGKLDIDSNQQVALKYGIQSIPTLLIFKGGQVAGKLVGGRPKKQIADAVTAVL